MLDWLWLLGLQTLLFSRREGTSLYSPDFRHEIGNRHLTTTKETKD